MDPRLQIALGLSAVLLDEDAVRRLLRMEDLIPAMERALADLSAGKVVQPVRLMVPVAEHKGFFATMPACDRGSAGGQAGHLLSRQQGIPTHHALILLFRPETGEPLVTMDGRLITEMRTAAVSAVATSLLARPDASVLAILGSGVQARQPPGGAPAGARVPGGPGLEPTTRAAHSPSDSACARPARRRRRFAGPTRSSWPPARGRRCSGASGCRRGRT